MPFRITSPYAVRGIARQFVIPGPYIPVLGDELYAVQDVGDLAGKSPYAARRIGAQFATAAAGGAGIYSSLLVTPGAGTIFVVEGVNFNLTGATVVQWRLARPADVALVTVVSTTPFGCLNEGVAASGFIPTLAATLRTVTRNSTATGGLFGQIRHEANSGQPCVPPRGVVLRGERAETATSLLLTNVNDDGALLGTVWGTEYVAPPAQIP